MLSDKDRIFTNLYGFQSPGLKEAQKRGALRAYYPIEDAWQESIGIFGLLWAVAGVFAAAKIALK